MGLPVETALRGAMGRRVRVRYGDPRTGEDCLEEHGTLGTVVDEGGLALRHSARSLQVSLLDLSRVLMVFTSDGKTELWRHKKWHLPKIRVEGLRVFKNGKEHRRFLDEKALRKWLAAAEAPRVASQARQPTGDLA